MLRFVWLSALCLVIAPTAGCANVEPGCGSAGVLLGTCAIGAPCTDSLDCASSSCEAGVCTMGCTRAADCGAGQLCFAVPDGRGMRTLCSADCPPGTWRIEGDNAGLVCVSGHVVACSTLSDPGSVCDLCACPSGERCLNLGGFQCSLALGSMPCRCVAPLPVGSPCIAHVECQSLNCSGRTGNDGRHCEVAEGTPCGPGVDCVHCNEPASADPTMLTCRQSCDGDAECNGRLCVIDPGGLEAACYRDCTVEGRCDAGETCMPIAGDAHGRRYCAPG
jgi:hypothetical protein